VRVETSLNRNRGQSPVVDLMAGVDIPPANIHQTEPSGAEDCTASVAKGAAVEMELGPENRLLPEMLGEELWQAARAELVE
jgi:hypothetical protein